MLLTHLSQHIQHAIRKRDTLARLGGDKFGLLLKDCSLKKAIEITESIVSLIKNYEIHWENKTFHVGVSIGINMLTEKTQSIKTTIHHADMACYAGKNRVWIHPPKSTGTQTTRKSTTTL